MASSAGGNQTVSVGNDIITEERDRRDWGGRRVVPRGGSCAERWVGGRGGKVAHGGGSPGGGSRGLEWRVAHVAAAHVERMAPPHVRARRRSAARPTSFSRLSAFPFGTRSKLNHSAEILAGLPARLRK